MRRASPRHGVSERVLILRTSGEELEGWALNQSRGGLRVIVEAVLALGEEVHMRVGDSEGSLEHRARVVWLQEEADGVVAGMELLGASGVHRAAPLAGPDERA